MSRELIEFARGVNRILPSILRELTRRQSQNPAWGRTSVPQMLILESLYHQGRCIMRELAEGLSISTPAVTGLVDRMVESGYLKRVRDEEDRRVINIELTPKGTKVAKGVLNTREKTIQDVFGELTPSERETYLRILKKVSAIIIEKRSSREK